MKNKKYTRICGLAIGLMLAAGNAGCSRTLEGQGDTETLITRKVLSVSANVFAYEDSSKEAPVSCTIMGMVKSVEENVIQLEVMDSAEKKIPDGKPVEEMAEMPDKKPREDMAEMPDKKTGKDMPGPLSTGEHATLTLEDDFVVTGEVKEGRILSIAFDENGVIMSVEVSEGMRNAMVLEEQPAGVENYNAVIEYKEDAHVSSETYTSSGTDENAILVTGDGEVTLDSIIVERTSGDSTGGDEASFYGVGAAVLATDGEVKISDSSITTDAAGGAGVFAYGDGEIYVSNTKIATSKDASGGIHVAGGGDLYANNLEVTTEGNSAAAIRSDRGGGTMVVNNGSYTSSGTGSPAVYCTADIAINNANLTAKGSEAACMEGLNNLYFYNCNITGNMGDDAQNDTTWTMIVYQSMSGDSQVGNASMQIQGGNILSENGGLLYTTNTESNILLSDVDITYAKDSEFFLQCTGNNNQRGWGAVGANGADCTFTALNQEMEGNVIWDSVSTLKFYMDENSILTGAFLQDETWAGSGGDGSADLYIEEDSTWVVTADSTLTNLYNAGTIKDQEGKTVTVKAADGTVYVQGDSRYSITAGNYSQKADFTWAAVPEEWEQFTE